MLDQQLVGAVRESPDDQAAVEDAGGFVVEEDAFSDDDAYDKASIRLTTTGCPLSTGMTSRRAPIVPVHPGAVAGHDSPPSARPIRAMMCAR